MVVSTGELINWSRSSPTFRSSFCKPHDSARNLIKIRSPLRLLLFLLISSPPTHAASNPDLQRRPDRASNSNFNRYHRACSIINENATQLDSTLKIYDCACLPLVGRTYVGIHVYGKKIYIFYTFVSV